MLDIPKILDTAIRAPLWIFFAFAVGFGIVTFNPASLFSADDLSGARSLLGPPVPWWVISTSLFVSSAIARLSAPTGRFASLLLDRINLRISALGLNNEERALVSLFEIEAAETLAFVDDTPAVTALREKGYLHALLIGQDREWGRYRLPLHLDRLRRSNPRLFRSLFGADAEAVEMARANMALGFRRARRLVRP